MGMKQVLVSDRTGEQLDEKNKVSITVRQHPDLVEGEAKIFDVHRFELSHLPCNADQVRLELALPDGTKQQLSCTAEEFERFFTSSQLAEADSNRGRRTGFSPHLKSVNDKAANDSLKILSKI